MNASGLEAFFLPAEPGTRFALFYPAQQVKPRGGVLYVHPFAEEMNKSRRMAALQARAFAAAGYSVLQIDLYGCGDSAGDFGDARWDIWHRDLALAADWLANRVAAPVHLWGLRLGATLALDCWRVQPDRFTSALLWQPVANGEAFATQFLRLAVAGDALREGGGGVTTDSLRRRLSGGESIEVAGYTLAPALLGDIDKLRLSDYTLTGAPMHWLEVRGGTATGPSTAAQRVITDWQAKGMNATIEAVNGDSFWATQEIVDAPALVQASMRCYERLVQ